MISRAQELCRKLKPVLGRKVDGLWAAYLADSDPGGRADIEQTLELLAAKHLGRLDYPGLPNSLRAPGAEKDLAPLLGLCGTS